MKVKEMDINKDVKIFKYLSWKQIHEIVRSWLPEISSYPHGIDKELEPILELTLGEILHDCYVWETSKKMGYEFVKRGN